MLGRGAPQWVGAAVVQIRRAGGALLHHHSKALAFPSVTRESWCHPLPGKGEDSMPRRTQQSPSKRLAMVGKGTAGTEGPLVGGGGKLSRV